MSFNDHFSTVAADYAAARPEYPPALFDWIAAIAPARGLCWEAGCGSGQATRDLALRFDRVYASEPSAAQIAQAPKLANVDFVVEPAERCGLPDASADVACVAQALHWFDRPAYFAEVARVLKPGGVLVAWGYQDIVVDPEVAAVNAEFQAEIFPYWPPQRADIDAAYAGYAWPFPAIEAPRFALEVEWPLPRLLGYFSSYSASKRHREATGVDAVGRYRGQFESAWGDASVRQLHWPLFVHASRKPLQERVR